MTVSTDEAVPHAESPTEGAQSIWQVVGVSRAVDIGVTPLPGQRWDAVETESQVLSQF